MSKRRLSLIVGLIVLVIGAVGVTVGFVFLHKKPQSAAKITTPQFHWQVADPVPCDSTRPPRPGLSESTNLILKKLAEYEAVCQSAVSDQAMLFAPMPTSESEATQFAATLTDSLRDFAAAQITPLVVFEPSLNSQTIIADIRSGQYDNTFDTYFGALKNASITDVMMGGWVLFPEANTPTWHNTSPTDFATNVTKLAKLQKHYFPTSKTNLLLNSQTYANDSWEGGEYKSLVPYLENIPKGLIDSFGYQGFPYSSAVQQTSGDARLQATRFLPINLAMDATKKLGIKDIWLNSGSFSQLYFDQTNRAVNLPMTRRRVILRGIVTQAFLLQQAGLHVSFNLFAQNKLATAERTDWSYWPAGQYQNSDGAVTFRQLVNNLRSNHISLSLSDSF